jgi:hypothetical protein
MSLTITSLRTDYRVTEGWFNGEPRDCPYIIVNCCFQIKDDKEEGNWSSGRAKAEAENYREVLTIDDPKRYEDWLMGPDGWNFSSRYDGYGRAWTPQDCPWQYIEKFDTFHFREWIADCGPTRSIIRELEYYKEHGELPSVYRALESEIILSHLRALQSYWD